MVTLLVLLSFLGLFLSVKILKLSKVLAVLNELPELWRVITLADEVVRGRVALLVGKVGSPGLRLLVNRLDAPDAHLVVLGSEHVLETVLVYNNTGALEATVELIDERIGHHLRGCTLAINVAKLRAQRVAITYRGVHRVSNTRNVRHLGEVITTTTGPNKNIISQVANHFVCSFLGGHKAPTKGSNMLVVPGVSISNSGSVANTSNLIAIVPPGHYTSILRSVVTQPEVSLAVVVNEHSAAITSTGVVHNAWV
mmetsp:Transcript_11449/g.22487  ORF Transcript_11449/g.22487 Transcript_11449/m.22487 type:complete len:254 (+) Transcript_11449:364-1125(+)